MTRDLATGLLCLAAGAAVLCAADYVGERRAPSLLSCAADCSSRGGRMRAWEARGESVRCECWVAGERGGEAGAP